MKDAAIGSASLWAKFGLPGLVIFALFTVLIFVIWYMVKYFDKIDQRNVQSYREMANHHREERSEWKADSNRKIDKFEIAIGRLADGIRDTRNN